MTRRRIPIGSSPLLYYVGPECGRMLQHSIAGYGKPNESTGSDVV